MAPAGRPYFYLGGRVGLTQLESGEPFFVCTRDSGITPWILLGGHWETFVTRTIRRLVRPGDRCLDVGANMGYYTVLMAKAAGPSGHVVALEPNPELFVVLERNIAVNGLGSCVTAHALAAGDAAGTARLSVTDVNMGGGSIAGVGTTAGIPVAVATIDSLLGPTDILDVVKIDAEGHEWAVVAGMQDVLARSPRAAVVLELSPTAWEAHVDPVRFLTRLSRGRQLFGIEFDGQLRKASPADLVARARDRAIDYALAIGRDRLPLVRELVA